MARVPDYVTVLDLPSGRRYEVRVDTTGAEGRRQQSRKRFRTLKAAIDHHSGVTADRGRGVHVAPSQLTLRQAVDAWLASQRIRPKTRAAYITALRPIVDALGDQLVQTLTKADIEAVVTALREGQSATGTWHAPQTLRKNAKKIRDPWAPSSINPMLARLRSIFADLQAQGIVVRSPAALVKPLPSTRPALTTLSAEQIAILLRATAADAFHIAWRLACYGLRRGEILALSWTDIDLKSGTLSITSARLAVAGGSRTGAPKTASSVRTLPLPADLTAALRAERKRQQQLQFQLGNKWPNSGLVVVDDVGNPPHPDSLTHAWSDALKGAKLPHVRLHDARHSCATVMHLNGVPAAVIAAWLGHTDARFTLSVYAHSNDTALAEAATAFSGALHGDKGSTKSG
ncbi:MAG: integrase [Actinomycetota bacterium]|nr:integrase [Actinomycetota bacterium]